MSKKILVVADTQCKVGESLDYMTWFGKYIVDKKPDVVVHIGDNYDMPSLSVYDKGKLSFEGRRVKEDLDAGKQGLENLLAPLRSLQNKQRESKKKVYNPRLVFCLGNHEDRIDRLASSMPELSGLIGTELLGLEQMGWEVGKFLQPVEIEGIFFCLTPNHKVLTRDLNWVALGDLNVGDTLVAFDEEPVDGEKYRKYKSSTVNKLSKVDAPVYKVTLSNGDVFKTTKDHRWLARNYKSTGHKWVTTEEMMNTLADGKNPYRVLKLFNTWTEEIGHEAGWLSGMFDGEGCLSKPNSKQGGVLLSVAQNPGLVLDKLGSILDKFDIPHTIHEDNIPTHRTKSIRILGASNKKIEFLGRFRPIRLIENFNPKMLGSVQKPDNMEDVYVVSVEYSGVEEIVMIETSTGTLIADGYAHHNCHYFTNAFTGKPLGGNALNILKTLGRSFVAGHKQCLDVAVRPTIDMKMQIGIVNGAAYLHNEEYKGYQNNNHFRGITLLQEVNDGMALPTFVSMEYLQNRYGEKK